MFGLSGASVVGTVGCRGASKDGGEAGGRRCKIGKGGGSGGGDEGGGGGAGGGASSGSGGTEGNSAISMK